MAIMASVLRCLLILLAAFFFFFRPSLQQSRPTSQWTTCSTANNYTQGDDYAANVKALFPHLLKEAQKPGASYFANGTSGNTASDIAFGLTMCYAHVQSDDCLKCLGVAGDDILAECPGSTAATIWYDNCFLRYDTEDFFSKPEIQSAFETHNRRNSSEPSRQKKALEGLMPELTSEASRSPMRLAFGSANYTENSTVYGMVQCTRDLSGSDCASVLNNFALYLLTWRVGVNMYGQSALMLFDNSPLTQPSWSQQLSNSPPPSPDPPHSQPPSSPQPGSQRTTAIIAGAVTAGAVFLLVVIVIVTCLYRRRNRPAPQAAAFRTFDLETLRVATDDFSHELGRGGFGVVYKGTLVNGQDIAVKRLSLSSSQGLNEFKNEVDSLVQLKHKNVVTLLGCCIQRKEKLLCYEYLPNGSLDNIIFAKQVRVREEFTWEMRYRAIHGICRGLLYLHEESPLKIVHRDLKASNILLDKDMKPKISDFGLARLFDIDQTHKQTSIIIGTSGYMAPEYFHNGTFSTKSDVYALGIILVEIITGRMHSPAPPNPSSELDGVPQNLLSFVWNHYKSGNVQKVIDPALKLEEVNVDEAAKCIHIGLLCIQEVPENRPSMESINKMLNNNTATFSYLEQSSGTSGTYTLDQHIEKLAFHVKH